MKTTLIEGQIPNEATKRRKAKGGRGQGRGGGGTAKCVLRGEPKQTIFRSTPLGS